jgi:hypothetical protein
MMKTSKATKEMPASAAKKAKVKKEASVPPREPKTVETTALMTDQGTENKSAKKEEEGKEAPVSEEYKNMCIGCAKGGTCVYEDFEDTCNILGFQIRLDLGQGIFKKYGLRSLPPEERWNRTIRYHLYREYAFRYHPQECAKGKRVVVPMCVVLKTREEYPNEDGAPYVGHKGGYEITI